MSHIFEDRELVVEFVNESRDHLADIESQLLDIEEGGANADLGLVNEVFRSIHSIKGAAGFMGFVTLGKLAHELENVLNLVRNRQLVPTSPIVDIMLKAADKLRAMIDDVEHSNDADIGMHLEALEGVIAALIAEEAPQTGAAPTPAEANSVAADTLSPAEDKAVAIMETQPQAVEPDDVPAATPQRSPGAPSEPPHNAATTAESSIRVGVGVLDKLMTLAGELV